MESLPLPLAVQLISSARLADVRVHKLSAGYLAAFATVNLRWTNQLTDHLILLKGEGWKSLYVFRHPAFLRHSLETLGENKPGMDHLTALSLSKEADDPTPVTAVERWSEARRNPRFTYWCTVVSVSIAIAFGMAATVLGAIQLAAEGLVLLETHTVSDGSIITTYGSITPVDTAADSNTTAARAPLAKRCGSNQPVGCDTAWAPAVAPCQTPIGTVQNNPGILLNAPRAVCYESWGNKCCISWSKDIGSVRQRDLHAAANTGLNICVYNGHSSKVHEVSINNQCLNQRLSNRATGCT
ncbi:hypothetical protein B0H63DRAFT_560226 [Podospora didyma]|uniref:WD-like domain-containing protein n=1 Tax=Podospora didyma TaxID=330526 RepID=A0AAE0NQ61_9PEZI|nr:hypothetical protein B0H63DRAFT_560226 [Podospora didyma]